MGVLRRHLSVVPGVETSRRYKGPSASDLLPWAIPVDSGIVQTKLGAFIVGYWSTPPDTASSTGVEQAGVSDDVQVALARFGAGWSSWTDVINKPAAPYPSKEDSHFPEEIPEMIDEERRRAFESEGEHFDNERALFLCYMPPHVQVSKFQSMMYSGGTVKTETPIARLLENFKREIRQFEDECGKAVKLRRMEGYDLVDPFDIEHHYDELTDYLFYAATGFVQRLEIPIHGAYLDSLIGCQDIEVGETPRIGDDYVKVVTIQGYPAKSFPNIIASLSTMPMAYRMTQRFIFMDAVEAEANMTRYRNQWSSKVTTVASKLMNAKTAPQNQYAVDQVKEATVAISLSQAGARFGYYSCAIVLRHYDEAVVHEMARVAFAEIRKCGFSGRIEATNTFEAWRGSLPGDIRSNIRRPPVHTGTLADLLPLSGVYTGKPFAPCPLYPPDTPPLMFGKTAGRIPFRMNIHDGDVGHTLCFGPTGAGKSALMNSIAMQALRYRGMRITAFDFKMGMLATVTACKGNHYNIGLDAEPLLCPLANLETVDDRLWAVSFIAELYAFQHNDRKPDTKERDEIALAIDRMSERSHRSLTAFNMFCSNEKVQAAVRFYTLKGSAGHLLDADADRIKQSYFNVYEVQTLMGLANEIKLPVLSVLFRRFEKTLNGQPALLFISEAWMAFGHPAWAGKVEGWLRLLRSLNCALIMDTQNLSDAVKSGILSILNDNCPTKLFLANNEAFKQGTPDQPGSYDLYKMMGLNQTQISIIQRAQKKRDVYWTSPDGNRLTALDLGPLQLAIVGATAKSDVRDVQAHIENDRDTAIWRYLDQKGVDYAALR